SSRQSLSCRVDARQADPRRVRQQGVSHPCPTRPETRTAWLSGKISEKPAQSHKTTRPDIGLHFAETSFESACGGSTPPGAIAFLMRVCGLSPLDAGVARVPSVSRRAGHARSNQSKTAPRGLR